MENQQGFYLIIQNNDREEYQEAVGGIRKRIFNNTITEDLQENIRIMPFFKDFWEKYKGKIIFRVILKLLRFWLMTEY